MQAPKVPASATSLATAWGSWTQGQHFTGRQARADYANPEQMNRYTWYQAHNWTKPYPGDSKVYLPKDVPGAAISSAEVE